MIFHIIPQVDRSYNVRESHCNLKSVTLKFSRKGNKIIKKRYFGGMSARQGPVHPIHSFDNDRRTIHYPLHTSQTAAPTSPLNQRFSRQH